MLMKDRFKGLCSEVVKIKRVAEDNESKFWNLLNDKPSMIGYGFYMVVPETPPDLDDIEEFDKYEVTGILDENFEITTLDISPHPEGPEEFWAEEILTDDYANQYLGLKKDEIHLSPDGTIDAISDGTLSSLSLTDAIRAKIMEIEEIVQRDRDVS